MKQGGKPPAALPEDLHRAVCQRIVGSHMNDRRMPLDRVGYVIDRLAEHTYTAAETKDNARLREHLERATGLTISELAHLAKRWPTG